MTFANKSTLKTRLAPTPSGFLHIGNGASFVATWALARAQEGKILLRIDDLDAERMRPEYIEDIFRTLDWLGVDWDEGPFSAEDFFKNWSQHLRLDSYEKALQDLARTGHIYTCSCSRKDIRLNSKNGLYPNTCRNKRLNIDNQLIKHEKNTAWRINIGEDKTVNFKGFEKIGPLSNSISNIRFKISEQPTDITGPLSTQSNFDEKQTILSNFDLFSSSFDINLSQLMGDFIVRQKNGLPAYQLASLIDDTLYNINFIVRGEDLLPSTAAQILLADTLNQADFLNTTFWHHPLMTDAQGLKLSKSEGAASLLALREMNLSASVVVKQAAKWLGLSDFQGETTAELVNFIKF